MSNELCKVVEDSSARKLAERIIQTTKNEM